MKALIPAAGKGIRMEHLTAEKAKVMIEVAGKPLLQRLLEMLKNAGIREVVVVVGYKKEQIMDFFGGEFEGVKINYAVQEEQKGTAHATAMAKQFIDGDFVSINGDVLVEERLIKELAGKKGYDAVMVGREVDDISRFGALEIEDGLVKNIIEKPKAGETETRIANTGIYRFSQKIFDAIARTKINPIRKEYELTDSIKIMINEGARVGCVLYDGFRIDVSNPKDIAEAEKMFRI